MKTRNKLSILFSLLVAASMLLSACQPQTIKVVETVVVEKEGQKVVETVVVEVPKTPEPESTEDLPVISPEFRNPDTYVVITGAGEPETLDPAWIYETAGQAVANNIYEGLVFFNKEKTDEFIPALATEWETSEDGKTWTFKIREGVKFHKGGDLEPHDVAYTVYRSLLQGRLDGHQWILYEAFFGPEYSLASVKDFAAVYAGKPTFEELTEADLASVCEAVKKVVVADDEAGTVTYNLVRPIPWLLALMSQNFLGSILDQEWMAENGDWDGDCETWVQFADPFAEGTLLFDRGNGTGPYMLDHWTPNEEIVLTANENYWRTEPMWEGGPSGAPPIKRVVIKNITEWGTRLSMFETGDADHIYVPALYRPQLRPYFKTECALDETCEERNANGYVLAYTNLPQPFVTPAQLNWDIDVEGGNPYLGSGTLDGNGIPADFFQDIHIRKAFNYCFDFGAMLQDAFSNEAVQAQGPIPVGMMGYLEGQPPLYSYDQAKCEEEFKLADVDKDGIPAGEDEDDVWNTGFYFQIAFNTGNDERRLSSEILKAGIEAVNDKFSVAVVGMPWPVMLAARKQGKLPVTVAGWVEDYHDPHNWVQPFLYSQGNYSRVIRMTKDVQDEVDALIKAGAAEIEPEKRRGIYEQLQLLAQEKAINIWMYQRLDAFHFQPWIQGFFYNPAFGQPPYSWIYSLSKVAP